MRQILVNENVIELPNQLSELTLGQRIAFQNEHGNLLDEMFNSIMQMPSFHQKLESVLFNVEKALRTFSFFTGISLEVLRVSNFVDEITVIYFEILEPLFNATIESLETSYMFNGQVYTLPNPEIEQDTKITFGELIDAKQSIKENLENGSNKWAYLLPLCAIFLRPEDEQYNRKFLYPNSERLKLMEALPMDAALAVGVFFDKFSDFCSKHFPVFFPGKGKTGKALKQHFDSWGWVNFLKEIAHTHDFDIPGSGKNSIDCAREASVFDVLVYASETKEFNQASNTDLEAFYKSQKI